MTAPPKAARSTNFRQMRLAYLVLLLALSPTLLLFQRVRETTRQEDHARFDRLFTRVQTSIDRQVVRCVDQMYNMRALFAASDEVGWNDWQQYVGTMALRHAELGIRSIGYIERVAHEDLDEHAAARRADGDLGFTVVPEGVRSVYYPATFTTHFDPTAVVITGLDHAVRPGRLPAIEQAILADKPFATDRVNFVSTDGVSTNSGMFVYLPVYRKGAALDESEQRQGAVVGLIFTTFQFEVALSGIVEEDHAGLVDVEVYDGLLAHPEHLIYDGDGLLRAPASLPKGALGRLKTIPVLNRQWTIFMSTLPEFAAGSHRYLQWLVLFGGLTISALLFGVALVQVNARSRAEQDAAELQRSEGALAAETELLTVTLDSIGDGVITTGITGRIVSINRAAESLTGSQPGQADGRRLAEVYRTVDATTREPRDDLVEKVLKTGRIVETPDYALIASGDGRERTISESAAPIHDRAGNVVGVVLAFRDVTEKLKAEAQMLTESKLDSVGLLAGGIAHDFNNILLSIIGNISLARRGFPAQDEEGALLLEAENSALRARELTQQLLTFAKGSAPIRKLMPLGGIIQETCQFALRGSNVTCDCIAAPDAWAAEVDEGQFRQVLQNLIINARQAMPEGGRVDVRLENLAVADASLAPLPPGNYAKISVKDQGPGIRPAHLKRIFEPYFTTKQGGTGLGLATVYSIVKKHGGLIRAESAPGGGATFEVFLPASPAAPDVRASDDSKKTFNGTGRVLIVDDEEAILKTLRIILKRFGYEVETARDGNEAIERYAAAQRESRPFRAVIMDLTIPNGMGGLEAIGLLRKMDPAIKAIVSSGYSLDPIMADHRAHGFCGVIPKPFRPEDLGRLLEEVLETS